MMKYLFLLVLLPLAFTGCHSSEKAINFFENEVFPMVSDKSNFAVILVPLEGCSNCIERTLRLIEDNIEKKNIYVVLSAPGEKQVRLFTEDTLLDYDNVFIDTQNQTVHQGLVQGNPEIYFFKEGKQYHKFTITSQTIADACVELENSLQWPQALNTGLYGSDQLATPPTFPGGYQAFTQYLVGEIKHLNEKYELEGRAMVEFIVSPEGNISHVFLAKGVGDCCDATILKVVKNAPKWRPGYRNGEAVATKLMVPLSFEK